MDELLAKGHLEIPTLAGLKFTSHSVGDEARRCMDLASGRMCVLTGFDQDLSLSRALGFPGVINGSFNLVPLEAGRLFCLADKQCSCGIEDERRALLVKE